MASATPHDRPAPRGLVEELDEVTIRFAGDAGDGIHLVGAQFTSTSAVSGNEVGTLPISPAEIRAPAGSLAGVSAFQVHFSREKTHTPGDVLDTLVVMNPAALKANLADLTPGGILIANADAFVPDELTKAGYASNPLEDGSLKNYKVYPVPVTSLNREAVARLKLNPREADRCKNFFALGLVYWLYERPLEPTQEWVRQKFAKNPAVLEANLRTLRAGYHFGETTELMPVHYRVPAAELAPGRYRRVTGNEAAALALLAAARRAGRPLVFASYPITPATDLLHHLCEWRHLGHHAVQAEDQAAALNMALGAAFGGAVGATATSGPGMCHTVEALGLAVMTELPCVVIDVQRPGPSTGLPTKTEQADLLMALFGRPGECPLPVLAPTSPADCFATVYEAVRLAVRFMTPVLVLSDGHLAHGSETWRAPELADLPAIQAPQPQAHPAPYMPFRRDDRLVRPWAVPGTAGLEHRTGGLEHEDPSGNVSYDPLNHEWMVQTRARKVANVAAEIDELAVDGPHDAELLVVGWGGTFGSLQAAVRRVRRKGREVAHAQLRHLHPLPRNTGDVLRRHRKVLVAELNSGHLLLLLRGQFLVDAVGLNKVQGRPFLVREVEQKIESLLG